MSFNVRESHQQKQARLQKEKEDKAAKEQETIDNARKQLHKNAKSNELLINEDFNCKLLDNYAIY